MSLDHGAVQRIRASFDLVAPRATGLVDRFYERLFKAAPGVRGMFPADMSKQKGHLLAAIGMVVKHADDFNALEKPLMDMGARHVGYGAKPEHYGLVRDTLLATLAEFAGPAWNEQLNQDWTAALNAVASTMIRGAELSSLRAAA
ncbi:MAG: globin [Phycisphaerae bacterium]|nr:globin [Phycisphaerae bacterium]